MKKYIFLTTIFAVNYTGQIKTPAQLISIVKIKKKFLKNDLINQKAYIENHIDPQEIIPYYNLLKENKKLKTQLE